MDDVIDIRPHKILVNVTPVAEEDVAHTESDMNNMTEQKEFRSSSGVSSS